MAAEPQEPEPAMIINVVNDTTGELICELPFNEAQWDIIVEAAVIPYIKNLIMKRCEEVLAEE